MNNWISYHIFYFDGLLQEKMICECIYPLMTQMCRENKIEKWFFIRYWEGGPHIRLRFLQKEEIKDEVIKVLKDFIADNKSETEITKEQYYENHHFDGEQLDWEQLPWYGNNTIESIDYEREYERYGGEETIPYCESIFKSSSEMAAEIISATRNDFAKRISIALNLIIVLLYRMNIKPVYFFYYYRNVWDDFFNHEPVENNFIRGFNVESRLSKIQETMDINPLYAEWISKIDPDVNKILEIWEKDPNRIYGIVISLVHMFNNRLGITPDMERLISMQFVKESGELGYVLENQQKK